MQPLIEALQSKLEPGALDRFPNLMQFRWLVLIPVLAGLAYGCLQGLMLLVRCFYVFILASHRDLPLLDAYVESRNAVKRYGFWKHLFLITLSWSILIVGAQLPEEFVANGLVTLVLLPISVGPFVSAYRQTFEVEAENHRLRESQFLEMRDELQTAHDMQVDLLPDGPPEIEGYFLDGLSVPANNVGGDYFAYRWLDDQQSQLAIIVADVSGKAMQAAVTALRFGEILRYECRGRTQPGPILDGLTRALDGQIDDATFVTCCIAVLQVESGKVEIANAGHCYPYQVGRKSKLVLPVEINGLPLGIPAAIRPDTMYEAVTIDLLPGDGLVIYSDGVVEAQTQNGEMYEEDRLCDIIQRTLPTEGATTSIKSIYRSVDTFKKGAPRTDDITVVALKRSIPPDGFAKPQEPY